MVRKWRWSLCPKYGLSNGALEEMSRKVHKANTYEVSRLVVVDVATGECGRSLVEVDTSALRRPRARARKQ